MHATAVNRADLLQRRGFYPPPPGESEILGLEAAGVVASVGARRHARVKVGDRVCCLLAGGGYAEQVVVNEAMALPIPAGLDFVQAAAIPEAFYTAFVNIVQEASLAERRARADPRRRERVGTAAIQLVKAFGAVAYVTAGSDDKLARCRELGADAGINYKTESFPERIAALTDGEGVDVILDCIGGSYLEGNVASLRSRGRLVIIGLMGGTKADVNLGLLVSRRLRVIGSVLRTRSLAEKVAITDAFRARGAAALRERHMQADRRRGLPDRRRRVPRTTTSRPTRISARSSCRSAADIYVQVISGMRDNATPDAAISSSACVPRDASCPG